MRYTMTTVRDLRNWVDTATANWDGRTEGDVDQLTDVIRHMEDRPEWGRDWQEFLEQLPELTELLKSVPTRTVTIHRTRFTDVQDGDYVDPDVSSEVIDCTPEVDDETAVDEAVSILENEGLTQPSSSVFHGRVWYELPDGSTIVNYQTGEREAVTAHLNGFSLAEQMVIWERVTKRG